MQIINCNLITAIFLIDFRDEFLFLVLHKSSRRTRKKLIVNLHKVLIDDLCTNNIMNGADLALMRRNLLDKSEIKQMIASMVADSESVYMCITEDIQAQLQIPFIEKRKGKLADGSIVEYNVVAPIEVRFKNRSCSTSAMVLPNDKKPLLGRLAFIDMDVIIDYQKQELIVHPNHPDCALTRL